MRKISILLLLIPIFLGAQTLRNIEKLHDLAALHFKDGEYDKSFKEYTELVEYGDSFDYYVLALHYYNGYGVEKDKSRAIEYYCLAADEGHLASQAFLSEYFHDKEDYDRMYRYTKLYNTNLVISKSTYSADDTAKYNMYLCYKNGWGTEQNEELADIWLSFAAYFDSYEAQEEYGQVYNVTVDGENDAEEDLIRFGFYKHLYNRIEKYIENDTTLEAKILELEYRKNAGQFYASPAIDIFKNPSISFTGKATLYKYFFKDFLSSSMAYSVEGVKNNKDIEPELMDCFLEVAKEYDEIRRICELYKSEFERTSNDDCINWYYGELIKAFWMIDMKLNPTKQTEGVEHDVEWVDLGLPSGNKWAKHNIRAFHNSNLVAWAELKGKDEYTLSNYDPFPGCKFLTLGVWDVASIVGGINCSVPTFNDWAELIKYCDYYVDDASLSIVFRSPNGMSINIPLLLDSEQKGCFYWTKQKILFDIISEEPTEDKAVSIRLYSDSEPDVVYKDAWCGCCIRPIFNEKRVLR